MYQRRGLGIGAMLGLLAACTAPGSYDAPGFPFQSGFNATPTGSPVLLSNIDWWKRFNDPVLNSLVSRALSANLSLEAARERVIGSQAELRTLGGAISLTPDLLAQSKGLNGGQGLGVIQGGLSFNWLLDPFGGRRDELSAASARATATAAEVNAAQLLVLLNLSGAYIDLRFNQRLFTLRAMDLGARRKTLALTQTFFDAGSATRLDLVQAEAAISDIESQLPALKAAILAKKAEIAVLVGVAPGQLATDLDKGAAQPRPRLSTQVGIPADLVRNRPDILIAERLYYAAVADVGAAKADQYPKLSLGGAITLTTVRGNSDNSYFFGPSLQFPPILSGAPRAAVAARESRARQSLIEWKSTVLQAILQVEQALVTYSAASASVASSEKTVRLYREAVGLTEQLIAKDGATIRDLIDAETKIANANVGLADNLRQLAHSFVGLNISLGSGNAFRAELN